MPGGVRILVRLWGRATDGGGGGGVSTVLSEAVDRGEVMSDTLGVGNVEEETALALRFVD